MTPAPQLRASGTGRHWVSRPLPEPPRSRRVSKWSSERPLDRLDSALEEWLAELTVGNTIDAD